MRMVICGAGPDVTTVRVAVTVLTPTNRVVAGGLTIITLPCIHVVPVLDPASEYVYCVMPPIVVPVYNAMALALSKLVS